MKEPYIKKFSNISGFDVWIVDGEYIRENLDEEFTNFGQHYRFKFIPKNEFWIDESAVKGEERYYIDHLLAEYKFMSRGMIYDRAIEKADKIESAERHKSRLFKKLKNEKKHGKELIEKVHQKLWRKYSGNIKIWTVRGELVRDLFFIDFTEGGHDKVYSFVPKGEVWIDDDLIRKERKFVLLHELHERNLMSKGMNYDKAHAESSEIEFQCRHHPKLLNKKIERELKKEQ